MLSLLRRDNMFIIIIIAVLFLVELASSRRLLQSCTKGQMGSKVVTVIISFSAVDDVLLQEIIVGNPES